MIRSIIHRQDHSHFGVLFHQQFFQEADECRTVLRLSSRPGEGVFLPVETAKDMPFLLCPWTGSRNPPLLSTLHPPCLQRRVQGYRRFV